MTISTSLEQLASHMPLDGNGGRYPQEAIDALWSVCRSIARKAVFLDDLSNTLTPEQAESDRLDTAMFFFEDGSLLAIGDPQQSRGPAEVWR